MHCRPPISEDGNSLDGLTVSTGLPLSPDEMIKQVWLKEGNLI